MLQMFIILVNQEICHLFTLNTCKNTNLVHLHGNNHLKSPLIGYESCATFCHHGTLRRWKLMQIFNIFNWRNVHAISVFVCVCVCVWEREWKSKNQECRAIQMVRTSCVQVVKAVKSTRLSAHRITSVQSRMHISKFFSHINLLFCQSTKSIPTQT